MFDLVPCKKNKENVERTTESPTDAFKVVNLLTEWDIFFFSTSFCAVHCTHKVRYYSYSL